jgi:DNA-binding cell septation regulator SpoVG
MSLNLDKLKVRVKPIEHEQLKAILSLDFGDWVIKGFRVLKSRYENQRGEMLWLVPPAYKDRNEKYHPIFFVTNKELWQALEERIWEEYHREMEAHYRKRFDLPEEGADERADESQIEATPPT